MASYESKQGRLAVSSLTDIVSMSLLPLLPRVIVSLVGGYVFDIKHNTLRLFQDQKALCAMTEIAREHENSIMTLQKVCIHRHLETVFRSCIIGAHYYVVVHLMDPVVQRLVPRIYELSLTFGHDCAPRVVQNPPAFSETCSFAGIYAVPAAPEHGGNAASERGGNAASERGGNASPTDLWVVSECGTGDSVQFHRYSAVYDKWDSKKIKLKWAPASFVAAGSWFAIGSSGGSFQLFDVHSTQTVSTNFGFRWFCALAKPLRLTSRGGPHTVYFVTIGRYHDKFTFITLGDKGTPCHIFYVSFWQDVARASLQAKIVGDDLEVWEKTDRSETCYFFDLTVLLENGSATSSIKLERDDAIQSFVIID